MKTEAEIKKRLDKIESDPRLRDYKTATVSINAPLALVQMGAESESSALRWVLGLPSQSWPLKEKKT